MSAATAEIRETLDQQLGTPKAKKRIALPSRRTLIVGASAAAVALAGSLYIVAPAATQKTEDAYIGADLTTVAPKVRGLV